MSGPGEPAAPATYRVEVLGCKVNQAEARRIAAMLEAAGLVAAAPGAAADIGVVHTCAVTRAAAAKSARRARRTAGEVRRLIVTGCAGAEGLLPGSVPASAVVPPGAGWPRALAAALEALSPPLPLPDAWREAEGPPVERFGGQARAFLKVQDGCDRQCTYCIVPSLRGPPRDRPLPAVRAEARALAAAGHAELVVCGVSVGRCGSNGGAPLVEVLRTVARVPGVRRIRLSSLHPAELDDGLLAFWAACPRMAPQLHLPLQSGSDAVLHRMGRGTTVARFRAAVARVRARLDRPAITTDVMVGFPGETGDDFARTVAFCREIGFARLHVFPFSPRPGTPAAGLRPQVDRETVRRRARELGAVAAGLALDAHRAAVGTVVEALGETRDPATALWSGYTERYLPIAYPGPPGPAGRLVRLRVTSAGPRGLRGRRGS